MPDVTVTAIVNPSSGPGNKVDAQYTQAIRSFTGAGGKAIGYVSTRYGAVSQAKARQHIDRYLAFYGREHISGFFLDEMADNASKLAFYRELHDYIKGVLFSPVVPVASGNAVVSPVPLSRVTWKDLSTTISETEAAVAGVVYQAPNHATMSMVTMNPRKFLMIRPL